MISRVLHYYKSLSLMILDFIQLIKVSKYYPYYIKYFIKILVLVNSLIYLKVKTCGSEIKKVKSMLWQGIEIYLSCLK